MEAGYIKRSDLIGLSVRAVRDMCAAASARMKQLDKMGKAGKRPAEEIDAA